MNCFRDRLAKHHIATPSELESIFSNINDLIELTLTLIGSLEDNLEMTEEGKVPAVGTCFEELAEAAEFEVRITLDNQALMMIGAV